MKKTFIAIIIFFALGLIACAGSDSHEKEKSTELDKQITQSLNDFVNRPVYKELTEQIIDTIPDNKLIQVIFDNLSGKQPENHQNVYATVMSWNKSRQAIYMIWMLEAEVNNGGFNQFYFNFSGQFYKQLPAALKLVGAKQFAGLMQNANDLFEKENAKITQHQDGTLEGFSESYVDNPLNKLDERFYDLYKKESLSELQIAYIRSHKTDFTDK
ncbi:DUF4375 domain-containing protein [Terrimonas rubra]|uniref:DUF4375 domain-containing protein n=1 Tax=Terrimonas rubra TaxID=1035890 RepID=A0ABW6A9R0_9BACT